MAFKTEQLMRINEDIDQLLKGTCEDAAQAGKQFTNLQHYLQRLTTNQQNPSPDISNIGKMILNQTELCENMRIFKDLLMEGFRLLSRESSRTDREQVQRLSHELEKQQGINRNMKKEVLELNELINDHIQMSRKKIEDKDKQVNELKKKYERLLEERKNEKKDCSILVEEENTEKEVEGAPNPLLQTRMSLQTIKQESQINTSNLKTEERFIDVVFPQQTPIKQAQEVFNSQVSTELLAKTTQIDVSIPVIEPQQQVRVPAVLRTEESSQRRSSSKTKAKAFIDDFRRASGSIELSESDSNRLDAYPKQNKKVRSLADSRKAQTQNLLQVYAPEYQFSQGQNSKPQNTPSANISSSSSYSHLSVAQNQNEGLWLPYKDISPKKMDYSKNKNPWRMMAKKPVLPRCQQNSLNEIKVCDNISVEYASNSLPKRQQNLSAKKQKIFVTQKEDQVSSSFIRLSSKDRLRDRDSTDTSFSKLLKSNSKEKLVVTMKNSSDLSSSSAFNSGKGHLPSRKSSSEASVPELQYLARLDININASVQGLRYEGKRKQGLRNGKGRLEYSSGVYYDGDFKDNVRHGYGVLYVNGKEVYAGEWQRDKICGSGTIKNLHLIHKPDKLTDPQFLTFLRECWYSGEFEQNRFHGNGTLFTNGQKIIGKFHDGLPQGEYTRCKKDGKVQLDSFRVVDLSRINAPGVRYHR